MANDEQRHTRATEDYLKELFRLELANQDPKTPVPTGDLANAMEVAPPSATAMLRRLHKDNLIEHVPYKGAVLTDEGRRVACMVLRKHRLLETFLAKALGLDWSEVHDEAENLEHAVSDKLLDRIDAFLGHPASDPHGDPIPDAEGNLRNQPSRALLDCRSNEVVTILTVKGHDAGFFNFLSENGLELNTKVRMGAAHPSSGVVLLHPIKDGDELPPVALSIEAAELLRVED